jgi:hypothetical protein
MDTTITSILALVGVLAGALVLVAVMRQMAQLDVKTMYQSSLSGLPEIRCFKCGKQMEEGFVAIGGMSWRALNSSPRKFTGSGEKLKNICQDQSVLIFSQGVPESRALRCRNCLLILVDHSQLFVFNK